MASKFKTGDTVYHSAYDLRSLRDKAVEHVRGNDRERDWYTKRASEIGTVRNVTPSGTVTVDWRDATGREYRSMSLDYMIDTREPETL